jgi:hypothetical protein
MMKNRRNERGSASTKMIVVAVVLFLVAHAGYKYVPIAYSGQSLMQDMQTAVVQATALPTASNPTDVAKNQIYKSGLQNGMPPGTPIVVKSTGGTVSAHVKFSQKVALLPFGLGNYTYEFDHTASPGGFMGKQ